MAPRIEVKDHSLVINGTDTHWAYKRRGKDTVWAFTSKSAEGEFVFYTVAKVVLGQVCLVRDSYVIGDDISRGGSGSFIRDLRSVIPDHVYVADDQMVILEAPEFIAFVDAFYHRNFAQGWVDLNEAHRVYLDAKTAESAS